jgi:acyl carrier protein
MSARSESIRLQLRAILTELSRGASFGDADDVFATGVVRSINLIELITSLEDTYGFAVTQREVFEGHLRSVERLVGLVLARTVAA